MLLHHASLGFAGALACCAIAGPSQAAPMSAVTNPVAALRSSLVDQVWCCRYHHRYRHARHRHWRGYSIGEPKRYTFSYYYGFLPKE